MIRRLMRILRPLYALAALMAVVHVVLLIGAGGYAVLSGKVDRGTVEQVAAVLRGETSGPAPAQAAEPEIIEPQGSADTSAQMIQDTLESEEMERFKRQRALADLRQLDMLWNRRALKLQKDQESFEGRVTTYRMQQQKRREQDLSDAHKKLIATVAQMDPKKSRDFLRSSTAADALRILLELPVRKRKSILESCKTADETLWRDTMLKSMARQPAATAGTAQLEQPSP